MNALEQLKAANDRAQEIIKQFTNTLDETPDVVAERVAELQNMKKDDLISLILDLEKPKADKAVKIQDVARTILESPECAIFTYEQIADMVHTVLPDSSTSHKSIATYVSKNKETWAVVPRTKLALTHEDLLKMVNS